MKYLVCIKDAVRPEGRMNSSDLFPIIVDYPKGTRPDLIVQETLQNKWPGYQPKDKAYYCIPMEEAYLVSFVPRQVYDVFINPVE